VAAVPPMGWNGYNHWGPGVTGAIVRRDARALVSSGMAALGYEYVNLDGGWDRPRRDARGALQADPAKFPGGIRELAGYVHSLGLKFGIYASAGTANCSGTSAGSYGHYRQDAAAFAAWGVDFVKLDYCRVPVPLTPRVARDLAAQMSRALAATGRPIVLDVNDASGARDHDLAWTWARGTGAQLWRVSSDITSSYRSMVSHLAGPASGHSFDLQLPGYAGPGGWNDPDMLEVGNAGLTAAGARAEFSLWAEEAAPLIAGNDLTAMTPAARRTLTNARVIAVDQDPLGRQGRAVRGGGGHWVLVKPLAGGAVAVVLFNQTPAVAVISTTAAAVGLPPAASYRLRDLWARSTGSTAGTIRARVPPHGVVMYRASAARRAGPGPRWPGPR